MRSPKTMAEDRHFLRILATALAALAVATSIASSSEQVPVGPRAIALGGAFTSLADDASALYWNPAGLARIGHQEIAGTHANLFKTSVNDNLISFVLPLSTDLATALDWYHSGFDDGELGFGENRFDLGVARKVHRLLWAGAGAKLITRSTELDGENLRQERGVGWNFGLLAMPIDRVRLGLTAQDAFGTRIKESDGVSSLVYPRNIRFGASYAWPRRGTVAFDVDDRWHLGIEATPHELCALRFGAKGDPGDGEGVTWTYGLGLKANIFRIDWAREQHPTLDATDHFALAMEFNFNPSQVRIEKLHTRDLYTSLYKSYSHEPLGSVELRNLQDRPLSTRMSVSIAGLTSSPSEQEVLLKPRAVTEVPLTAVIGERALAQHGDQPITVQVAVRYQSARLARREKKSARAVAYAPGAIDWSAGVGQAAAFVTPYDAAVEAVAREAGRMAAAYEERRTFPNPNLAYAAAATDALAEIGIVYVPDPHNPFSSISETPHAVDTVNYPYQTLEHRSGDCDDTTVLLASLLANVGVATRFVDAPGHIFLLVDSGLRERNRWLLGDSTMTVVSDHEVWFPLETTAISKGFAEAWTRGAEEVQRWNASGDLVFVDVAEAQARYEPAEPPGERKLLTLDDQKVSERLEADARSIETMIRKEPEPSDRGGPSASALMVVARADFIGDNLARSREELERAVSLAPREAGPHNDLGVVLAAMDSLPRAEEHWQAALSLDPRQSGTWLNLGIARWARGDTLAALGLLARGIDAAGHFAAACSLLAIAPEDSIERASASDGDSAARSRLRAVLKRAASFKDPARSKAGARVLPGPASLVHATRAAGESDWLRYLYWAE